MIPALYPGYIVFRVAEKEEIQYDPRLPQIKTTNPISLIHAGKWVEYNEDNLPQEWLPRPTKLIDKRALTFKVEVDSMYPTLKAGWIVFVEYDRKPNVGDIAAL